MNSLRHASQRFAGSEGFCRRNPRIYSSPRASPAPTLRLSHSYVRLQLPLQFGEPCWLKVQVLKAQVYDAGPLHGNSPGSTLLALLLIVLGFGLHATNLSAIPLTPASPQLSLIGNAFAWNYSYPSGSNPQITVLHGQSLTVQLSSEDMLPHQLVVDVDNDGGGDASDCGTVDLCSAPFSTSPTTFSFSINFPGGEYSYYCSVHPMTMFGRFVVQDFGFASSPSSLALVQGSMTSSTITVTSLGGFVGRVNLTASVLPTGPVVSMNPTSIQFSADGSASSTLTISTSGTTPQGAYTVTVSATNGTLSDSIALPVTVTSTGSTGGSLPLWAVAAGAAAIIAIAFAVIFVRGRRKRASKRS